MLEIYGLLDPQLPNPIMCPFYIGYTEKPLQRYWEHLHERGTNEALSAHIHELLALGYIPQWHVYERPRTQELARMREAVWIHHFLALDVPLLNRNIPAPLHLRLSTARQETFARCARSRNLPCEEEEEIVWRLAQQGLGKVALIRHVWGASPGENTAYRQACHRYDEIMQQHQANGLVLPTRHQSTRLKGANNE
jgi:hypothetical protein